MMIELEQVTKLYGSVIGINDITLELPLGAYGLLGPNGSGKSTLLNLVTGQLRPTLGSVRTLGSRPWNRSQLMGRIGLCPEHDLRYPNVTAVECVSYFLRLHGMGRREAARRAEQSLEKVGLSQAMHRRIDGYSRGMRQRTKLAQAIAHDPELLILDEPLNGLDPVGRHAMTELLRDWIRRGRGLLLASHILHEVEAITESFLLICGGRLLASGSASEVHALLADVPNEIHLRCSEPRKLAQCLVGAGEVHSIRLGDDGESLTIATRSPATVYRQLPEWIDGSGIRIHELRSGGQSLQALFESLLRMHRGRS